MARGALESPAPYFAGLVAVSFEQKGVIDQKSGTGKEPRFNYTRVKDQGYHGRVVDEGVNLDEPLEQDDLLRAYGLAKVFMMAAGKAAPAGSSGADTLGQIGDHLVSAIADQCGQ